MKSVWVFFYGTFMSARILREYGVDCEVPIPARLEGYELFIRSRANLRKSESSVAYGSLAQVSHQDLALLYGDLVDTFGITYDPYPVIAELADGSSRPALTYISLDLQDAPPDPEYVGAMARCAAELEAPEAYIDHIKSFL